MRTMTVGACLTDYGLGAVFDKESITEKTCEQMRFLYFFVARARPAARWNVHSIRTLKVAAPARILDALHSVNKVSHS